MMEAIGIKAVGGERGITRIATTAPAAPAANAAAVAAPSSSAPFSASSSPIDSRAADVARQLSSSPPVDMERVAAIKRAIADGSFPILPSTIADRLLALRLEWAPNGEA
ncbi:flagellar biosynthesis anti-sigma factor FlgM [uncultured Sphingomonas sp.]|uniref:flagellar biosynthesis anti-sigma factor FlgM n=1 Tax=uncultured Sphingomonas sp. TaxID=158754 RepID=UPI0035C9ACD3